MLQVDLTLHLVMVSNLNSLFNNYRKVASTSPSYIKGHASFIRLPMKGLKDKKVLLTIFLPKTGNGPVYKMHSNFDLES